MKIKKKASVFYMIMVLVFVMSTQAFAETKVKDGLEVNFNSEKEEYGEKDSILTTVTIKNTNSVAVNNISVESIIPENYKISTDSEIEKKIDVLNFGDVVSFKITYEPNNSEVKEEETTEKRDTTVVKNDDEKDVSDDKVKTTEKETVANEKITEKGNGPRTGDNTNYKIWIGLCIFACGIIVLYVMSKKKSGKKIIPFMIILSFAVISNVDLNYAEEMNTNCISATTAVKVNNSEIELKIYVKYEIEMENEGLEKPENPTETDDYFWDNSKVLSVIDANESQEILSESEVVSLLTERGFVDYSIIYDYYSEDGEYVDSLEIVDGSTQKHPMYETYYVSENGDVWNIYVINGSIFANPASYNFESEIEAQVLFSESQTLTSYAVEGNKFYVTVPYESFIILKQIDQISATELDKIVWEEMMDDEK